MISKQTVTTMNYFVNSGLYSNLLGVIRSQCPHCSLFPAKYLPNIFSEFPERQFIEIPFVKIIGWC